MRVKFKQYINHARTAQCKVLRDAGGYVSAVVVAL